MARFIAALPIRNRAFTNFQDRRNLLAREPPAKAFGPEALAEGGGRGTGFTAEELDQARIEAGRRDATIMLPRKKRPDVRADGGRCLLL